MKLRGQWSKTKGVLWLNNPRKTENISKFKTANFSFLKTEKRRETGRGDWGGEFRQIVQIIMRPHLHKNNKIIEITLD